ncbi:putative ribonuclease H-like domain-containing protein [Tanacetum coccineum]
MAMSLLALISSKWSATTATRRDILLKSAELQEIKTTRTRKAQEGLCLWKHPLPQLVSCDGLGRYYWSDQAEEGPNYALMAYSSSSSDSESVLESVEKKLEVYKANESIYSQDIKVLKIEIEYKFENASKSLNKLIESQIVENCKKGLGYNAVPPPYIGNFMPPTPDLNSNDSPIVEDWVSDSEEENVPQTKTEKKIVKPSIAKIEFVKPKQQEKTARKTIKQVEKNRQNTHSLRGNQRNWNNMMSQRLGSNFEMFNKACYVCGSFDHLQVDCNYHHKQFQKQRMVKPVWNNDQRVNHQNFAKKNMVPRAVLMKSGLVSVNIARQVNAAHTKTTVNAAGPMPKAVVNAVKGNNVNAVKASAWNMSYLTDYEEIDGGYIAFGRTPKGGKIIGKGTIKTDDFSRFTWVFFLATKDETSGILKSFITGIENLVDHKVKVTRCDDGTEFKNREMNQFCKKKGILRQFSVARTPQQNGVTERRNRTLIEAARTMLADSKLPTTFWAEVVNTTCYLQNRVLVVKPYNKTPYDLFHGITLTLSFMRPFGCPITILNTIDHLGKFDGKADEGFFIGYSLNSKAFRVFNSRTRIVEENLHIRFSDNTPNVIGSGPDWLFDIDALTRTMNYEPIVADSKSSQDDGFKPSSDNGKKVDEDPRKENECNDQEKEDNVNNTNNVNAASTNEVNAVGRKTSIELSVDPNMPALEHYIIFDSLKDDEDDGAEADMNNLETTIQVSPNPTIRNHKDHPLDQEEPKKVIHALKDPSWIEVMQEELLQFKLQEVWTLVDILKEKRVIGTKWVFRSKKDERGMVIRNKARLVAQRYTQEEGLDYDQVFSHVARIEAIRLFLAYALFKDFVVYQMNVKSAFLYRKIEEEVYVCQPPGFEDPDFPDRVYKVEKALYGQHQAPRAWYETLSTYLLENEFQRGKIDKTLFIKRSMIGSLMYLTSSRPDIMFAVCACARYQVNPKVSHLHAVKRIVSDYTGASLNRKSTTGGCQFLGCRLISWQCKKQTVVANSTTEAEYVDASSCFILSTPRFKLMLLRLHALIDGKKIIVTEATVRRDLHLEDAEGVECLPNATIFEELTRMGIYLAPSHTKKISGNIRRVGKGFSGRVTPLFPTMVEQNQEELGEGSAIPIDPHHTPTFIQPSPQPQKTQKPRRPKKDTQVPQSSVPSDSVADEDVYKELDDSLVRAATTASSLEAEQDNGGGPKRQETIGDTIAQTRFENVSKLSNDPLLARGDEESLGEDASKQGRRIDDIDADETITLTGHDDEMFDVDTLNNEEMNVAEQEVAAKDVDLTVDEVTLAQSLTALKRVKLKVKGIVIQESAFNRVNTFVNFRTDLVEGSLKRAGETLEQKSTKKQKVDEHKSTKELQSLMEVIPDEQEVAIDAIPLATKSPSIVD